MTVGVLQRPDWFGEPVDQGDCFRLVKGDRRAVCRLFTHQFGWELRLEVNGETVRTAVCRDQDAVIAGYENWKAAMVATGWSEPS